MTDTQTIVIGILWALAVVILLSAGPKDGRMGPGDWPRPRVGKSHAQAKLIEKCKRSAKQ